MYIAIDGGGTKTEYLLLDAQAVGRTVYPDNAYLYLLESMEQTADSSASNRTRLNEGCASIGKIIGKKNKIANIYGKIFGKSTVAARAVIVIVFAVCKLAKLAGSALAARKEGEDSRATSDEGFVVSFNDLTGKFVSGNGGEMISTFFKYAQSIKG